ncbi:unnamed protein product [Boreogadus saida]
MCWQWTRPPGSARVGGWSLDEDAAISPHTSRSHSTEGKAFFCHLCRALLQAPLPPAVGRPGDPPGSSSHGYAPINAGGPFEASGGGGEGKGEEDFLGEVYNLAPIKASNAQKD